MQNENPTPETGDTLSLPVRDEITAWLLKYTQPAQHVAIQSAHAACISETQGFVRSRNYTAYNIDELAASSCRIEPILGKPGKFDLNYSTMKGRRVHDIVRMALLDLYAPFVFPATKREDGKLNHQRKAREKWVAELGFKQEEIGKGKRWSLFGDNSAELIAKLEPMIPEHFEGTEQAKNAKVSITMVGPSSVGKNMAISVYKKGSPEENIKADTFAIVALRKLGFTFTDDPNEHAAMYLDLSETLLQAEAEEAKAKKEAKAAKQKAA